MMDFLVSPFWLCGIIMGVALGAFSLGQKQHPMAGKSAPDAPLPQSGGSQSGGPQSGGPQSGGWGPVNQPCAARDDTPIIPCQQQTHDERLSALSQSASLALLHAEVSAYRRRERIFAALPEDAWQIEAPRAPVMRDCHFVELTGEPTCGLPHVAPLANGCSRSCCDNAAPPFRNDPAAQLSREPAAFTRM